MSIRKYIRLQILDPIAVIRIEIDDDDSPRSPTPAEQLADACQSLNEYPNTPSPSPTRHSRASGNPSPQSSPHPFWSETLNPHKTPSPSMGEGWDGGDSPNASHIRAIILTNAPSPTPTTPSAHPEPVEGSSVPLRHSRAPTRHSRAPTRHSRAPTRHSREGGNPSPQPSPNPFWPETPSPSSFLFPAKAGIHLPPSPSMGEGWDGGDSPNAPDEDPESALQRRRVASHVTNLKVPTIAAIHGRAWNQGLEIGLACDLRIAAEDSTFGFSSLADGVIPWDGGTQRLPRIIGRARALDLLLTGRSLSAHEALEIGLLNAVAPSKDLEAAALNLAQTIADAAPIATRYLKEAVHKGLDMSLSQGLNLEADLSFILQTTQDRKHGIQSFLNKTTPKFTAQ